MRTSVLFTFSFVLLFSAACGNKVDDKIDELAAKPAASTISDAKKLYDEAADLVRWLEAKKEPSSPEQLAAAKVLRQSRMDEMLRLGGDKVVSGVKDALGAIGLDGIDLSNVGKKAGEAKDWLLGVNDPRLKKFGCPDDVDVTQEGSSRHCP